jgi:putative membrane protein
MRTICRSILLSTALAGMSGAFVACHHAEPVKTDRDPALSQGGQSFIAETEQLATQDREFGTLVRDRSASAAVKKYADIVIKDDSGALEKLAVVIQKYRLKEPSPAGERLKDDAKLKSLSRKALDRQFVSLIVRDDEHAVAMLQEEAHSQADPDLRQYASDILPAFQSDLKKAQDLQAKTSPAKVRSGSSKRKQNQVNHLAF